MWLGLCGIVNNQGLIHACFQEHITYPKRGQIFKIFAYLDSARQIEEKLEAGFLISRCNVGIYQCCKIWVRIVLLGMPAKTSESCLAPPNLELRRSTKNVSQQSHCGIAHLFGTSEGTEVTVALTSLCSISSPLISP